MFLVSRDCTDEGLVKIVLTVVLGGYLSCFCFWSTSHFGFSTPFCDFDFLPLWKVLLVCKQPAACLNETALPEVLMTTFE